MSEFVAGDDPRSALERELEYLQAVKRPQLQERVASARRAGGDASPRDPMGNPGPYEEAVLQTPILENYERPEDYKGIDILRAIRSFDPCMPCTTHIHTGSGVISREVVTCACGAEDHSHDD